MADGGFRFCVLRSPPEGVRSKGSIIHLPAFGEEMNKSRHMVALQAHRLALEGWRVLQIDLCGTGDSSGVFADATWDAWLADVQLAFAWVQRQQTGETWLWGHRLGCLLAAEAIRRFDLRCGLLMWQPVSNGKQHLQQFLRLWKMAQVVGKLADNATPPQQRLAEGSSAEIAGYTLSPLLALGMQTAGLVAVERVTAVHWLQVGSAEMLGPPPAFEALKEKWAAAAVPVSFSAVEGAPFWQTQEISVVPALLECTSELLGATMKGVA